jgi:hypothetical protein
MEEIYKFGIFLEEAGYKSVKPYCDAARQFIITTGRAKEEAHDQYKRWLLAYRLKEMQKERRKAFVCALLPNELVNKSIASVKKLLFSVATGLRPVGAKHLTEPIPMIDADGWRYGMMFGVSRDKRSESREFVMVCCCNTDPAICFVHNRALPSLPLTSQDFDEICAVDGRFRTYTPRRTHLRNVVEHARNMGWTRNNIMNDEAARGRVNANMGWVPRSPMFLEYTKDYAKCNAVYEFLENQTRYYITGAIKKAKKSVRDEGHRK